MNPDFRDLFAEFNANGVEYLVVGVHTLAVHGHVRATKDLDVWVRPAQNKRSSGRTQDLADLERLEGIEQEGR